MTHTPPLKKYFFILTELLFLVSLTVSLTGCPGPFDPNKNAVVIGTYTHQSDEDLYTVTFFSNNTYAMSQEDRTSEKGEFSGTLAEGEMITLTPIEFNFSEDEGIDLLLTVEQAAVLFAGDEEALLDAAYAFMAQEYVISGTTLVTPPSGDPDPDPDPDPEDPPVIPPAGPSVVATYKETSTSYTVTFVYYSDNSYIQLQKGYPACGGTYTGTISAGGSIGMTQTTAPIYSYYADREAAAENIDFTLLTLEEAVTAILDETNTTAAPIRTSIASKYSENGGCSETNVRTELADYYQSSLETISFSDDGLSFTTGGLTFNKVVDGN